MGIKTAIEWCDSTVNPTTGCGGCELWSRYGSNRTCYAGNLHTNRLAKSLPNLYAPDFTEVRLAPGRMAAAAQWSDLRGTNRPDKPWLNGQPRTIFVGDMGDVFSRSVPDDYLFSEVFWAPRSPKGWRHYWLVLTKRASRAAAFSREFDTPYARYSWPENVWLGVSVTSQATVRRATILAESAVAPVKFLSIEPLLGWVHLSTDTTKEIGWVIVGGESGPNARPCNVDYVRRIVSQCQDDGVPVFVKQLGSNPRGVSPLRDRAGGDPSEWPDDLRVREFPGGCNT